MKTNKFKKVLCAFVMIISSISMVGCRTSGEETEEEYVYALENGGGTLRITETTYEVSGNSYFNGSGKCKRAGSYEGGMKYICYDEDGMPIAEVTRYYD